MRAQWVCSRGRRLALYKWSSINQSINQKTTHTYIPANLCRITDYMPRNEQSEDHIYRHQDICMRVCMRRQGSKCNLSNLNIGIFMDTVRVDSFIQGGWTLPVYVTSKWPWPYFNVTAMSNTWNSNEFFSFFTFACELPRDPAEKEKKKKPIGCIPLLTAVSFTSLCGSVDFCPLL